MTDDTMTQPLPLDLSRLADLDRGHHGAIWMPDHLVSFWPDAIWDPEFTDLAERSHSPHRYLDAITLAGAVAAILARGVGPHSGAPAREAPALAELHASRSRSARV